MKICTYFENGSRFQQMIMESLWERQEIEFISNKDFVHFSTVIQFGENSEDYLNHLKDCDFIFLSNKEHLNKNNELSNIVYNLCVTKYRNKTVIMDFKDEPNVDYNFLNKCAGYFKRSIVYGTPRRKIKEYENVIPLNFNVTNANREVIRDFPEKTWDEKEYDFGYYFSDYTMEGLQKNYPYNFQMQVFKERRLKFKKLLKQFDWSGFRTHFDKFTSDNAKGRRAIYDKKENNEWIEYLKQLQNTKIIFTCFPEHTDGDMRVWESMTVNSLVFMDTTWIPTPNYFQHGKDCFMYNGDQEDYMFNAIRDARKIILSTPKKCERIAKHGTKTALKYHKSSDRLDYILSFILDK